MASNNFFTEWVASVSAFTAAIMNAPLNSLDKAFSYTKNVMLACDGDITFLNGTLTWSGTIRIAYLNLDGDTITNTITAGNIGIAVGQFAYVNLHATNGTAVTISVATVTGNATCNFGADNRLVLAYRGSGGEAYCVSLRPSITQKHEVFGNYVGQPAASEEILRYPCAQILRFDTSFSGSQGSVRVAPSDGAQTYLIKKDNVQIGHMQFANGQNTATFSGEAGAFAAGEILTVIAPNPQDSTLEDVGFVIFGDK